MHLVKIMVGLNFMELNTMSITFTIKNYENGLAYGDLVWREKNLNNLVISGPYGRHELPKGLYHAYRSKLLDKNGEEAYCDSLQQCWMQVIDPQFSTDRSNLGIHPDGNKLGTLGCIGLFEANTKPWYDAFKSVKSGEYTVLQVL